MKEYEIRFYRKNDDKNVKSEYTWHTYGYFDNYTKARLEFQWLIDFYESIGVVEELLFRTKVQDGELEEVVKKAIALEKELVVIYHNKKSGN